MENPQDDDAATMMAPLKQTKSANTRENKAQEETQAFSSTRIYLVACGLSLVTLVSCALITGVLLISPASFEMTTNGGNLDESSPVLVKVPTRNNQFTMVEVTAEAFDVVPEPSWILLDPSSGSKVTYASQNRGEQRISDTWDHGWASGSIEFKRVASVFSEVGLNWYLNTPKNGFTEWCDDRDDSTSIESSLSLPRLHPDTQAKVFSNKYTTYILWLEEFNNTSYTWEFRCDFSSFKKNACEKLATSRLISMNQNIKGFVAALPDTTVYQSTVDMVVANLLEDVPLPLNFTIPTMLSDWNDWYQVAASVLGPVTCAWFDEWWQAVQNEDEPAKEEARLALQSSKDWWALHAMEKEGAWPEVLWEYVDQMSDMDRERLEQGLGCQTYF